MTSRVIMLWRKPRDRAASSPLGYGKNTRPNDLTDKGAGGT